MHYFKNETFHHFMKNQRKKNLSFYQNDNVFQFASKKSQMFILENSQKVKFLSLCVSFSLFRRF